MIAILAFAIAVLAIAAERMAQAAAPEYSLATVSIKLGEADKTVFFTALKEFSDKYAFAIRIAPSTPDNRRFLIQMWRDDFKIIGTNAVSVDRFNLSVFKNRSREHTPEALADLISAMRDAINRIPGLTAED